MRKVAVESNNVETIGYAPETQTLQVTFKNGGVYRYFDVPEVAVFRLIFADSIGRYLHTAIKPFYRCERDVS